MFSSFPTEVLFLPLFTHYRIFSLRSSSTQDGDARAAHALPALNYTSHLGYVSPLQIFTDLSEASRGRAHQRVIADTHFDKKPQGLHHLKGQRCCPQTQKLAEKLLAGTAT